MMPTDVEVWARLRLVQGRSKAQLWEFVSTRGQSLLTVGSGPGCTWVIEDDGVAPIHFSLHWDGTGLTIADTHGTGTVRVDGAQVRANWLPLRGRARIDFGRAAIVVETSGARLEQGAFDTAPLPPVSRDMRRASSAPAINASVSGAPIPKGTLMGVPPPNGRPAIVATVPAKAPVSGVSSAPQAPANNNPPTGQGSASPSFVPKRPGDSVRPPKPTLLGMSYTPVPVAPGAFVSAAPPPQRVGGSSLADGDQRTIQGFPKGGSVQAAMSVTVTGSPSSSPPSQPSSHSASDTSTVVPQLRPLSESLPPSTALVVAQREESGRHIRQRPNAPHGNFSGHGPGIPQTVLVLSPVGGPVVQAQRQSMSPQRPLPNWRPIAFGIFATAATYVCWLYLLYHL